MKKVHFSSLCTLIIAIAVIACKNDEATLTDKTNKFDTDLAEYVAKQKSILGSIVKTRYGESSTLEDLLQIAAKIDSCTADFVENHQEELAPIFHNLTEDEMESMAYDEEYLLEFVQTKYSDTVYNAMYNFINNKSGFASVDEDDFKPSISTGDNLELNAQIDVASNPEKFILSQIQVVTNFRALIIDEMTPEGLKKEYQNKSKECLEKYKADLTDCLKDLSINLAQSTIWSLSPIGLLVFSGKVLYYTNEFNSCTLTARNSLDECK